MDVWQLAIIGGAAFLAVRALVNMAERHGVRFRKKRKRELRDDHQKELDRLAAERAAAEEAEKPPEADSKSKRRTTAAAKS